MFECCKGAAASPNKLNANEVLFVNYAALIRGSIAFGLAEKIDDNFEHKKIIVSTILFLVISTTIIFGGFTPMV